MTDVIAELTEMAKAHSDGHFTICRMTTEWRVDLKTPNSREDIKNMARGKTLEEAVAILKECDRQSRELDQDLAQAKPTDLSIN